MNQLIDCLVAAKITARILTSDSEADAKIKGRYTRLYYNLIVQQLDGMISALESFKYRTGVGTHKRLHMRPKEE